MVRVKNEEWWIKPSLLSIKDLVNEYIVIDGSTDNTIRIIDEVGKEWGLNLRHVIDFDEDYVSVSNKALGLANYRWILRWDADFIAKEEMTSVVRGLIDGFDPRKFYVVYWPHICLDGDLFHQDASNPFSFEHWLASCAPKSRFVKIPHGWEYFHVPSYYAKRIELDQPLSFHLRTVRPPVRLLFRKYWHECEVQELDGKVRLEEYVQKRINEEYGVDSIDAAAQIYLRGLLSQLTPYDKKKYGDYPQLLKDYAKNRFGLTL